MKHVFVADLVTGDFYFNIFKQSVLDFFENYLLGIFFYITGIRTRFLSLLRNLYSSPRLILVHVGTNFYDI